VVTLGENQWQLTEFFFWGFFPTLAIFRLGELPRKASLAFRVAITEGRMNYQSTSFMMASIPALA